MIFPWQIPQWQLLQQMREQKRLPHALLFSGNTGIGKKDLAINLAHSLLCEQAHPDGACGQCRSCGLIMAKAHPDLLMIEPEEDGLVIKVDQIRELTTFISETAQQGRYRIVLLNPANAMNINAANALLKSLEEPPLHCVFLLVADQSKKLLPTIKSRCQEIICQKPERQIALNWLAQQNITGIAPDLLLNLADGAPLKALTLLENDFLKDRHAFYEGLYQITRMEMDPLQFAARWQEFNFLTLFELLQSWLRDLLRIKVVSDEVDIVNHDFKTVYTALRQKIPLKKLTDYIQHIQYLYIKVQKSSSMNRQLLLEELFIKWARLI